MLGVHSAFYEAHSCMYRKSTGTLVALLSMLCGMLDDSYHNEVELPTNFDR